MTCHQCCGTWVGFIVAWIVFEDITWGQIFIGGCAGSFLANFAAIYMNYLDAQSFATLPPQEKHEV